MIVWKTGVFNFGIVRIARGIVKSISSGRGGRARPRNKVNPCGARTGAVAKRWRVSCSVREHAASFRLPCAHAGGDRPSTFSATESRLLHVCTQAVPAHVFIGYVIRLWQYSEYFQISWYGFPKVYWKLCWKYLYSIKIKFLI